MATIGNCARRRTSNSWRRSRRLPQQGLHPALLQFPREPFVPMSLVAGLRSSPALPRIRRSPCGTASAAQRAGARATWNTWRGPAYPRGGGRLCRERPWCTCRRHYGPQEGGRRRRGWAHTLAHKETGHAKARGPQHARRNAAAGQPLAYRKRLSAVASRQQTSVRCRSKRPL